MRTILVTLAAVAFVSLSTAATGIKSTVKLSLSRLGSDSLSVGITDARVLALSNVFAGSFIGDRTDAPNASLRRYRIAFDIQTRDGIKTDAYLVQYCVDDAAGQAFVYLPGRDDAAYRRNVSTILRDTKDGHWHRASSEWREALAPFVR